MTEVRDIKTRLSDCRRFRYSLVRVATPQVEAAQKSGFVNFVCLNPSTADETKDDATIRKLRGFTAQWGYSYFVVTNLFAIRETDSRKLPSLKDPIGEWLCDPEHLSGFCENDATLRAIAKDAALVVCAWGNGGVLNRRGEWVRRLLTELPVQLHAFKITGKDQPSHPLYLPYSTPLVQW